MCKFINAVKEIVVQENKRYHLQRYKLIYSENQILVLLYDDLDLKQQWEKNVSFVEFKNYLLNKFYTQYVSFANAPLFQNWLYAIYKDTIKRLQKRYNGKETIDNGLKTAPYTAAFKSSKLLLSEIYTVKSDILCSELVEEDLHEACAHIYPVEIDRLMHQLRIDDPDFWDIMWRVINHVAQITASYHVNKHGGELLRKDKAKEKSDLIAIISENVHKTLLQKIKNSEISDIADGKRLRAYINTMSINSLLNESRRPSYSVDKISILEGELSDKGGINVYNLPIVDSDNYDEIKDVLIDIIYNQKTEIFDKLTKGFEQGLQVMKYLINGLSYKQIVEEMYGAHLLPNEAKTKNDALRKNFERTKVELVLRLQTIYKNMNNG